jgi:hypothetical protein
MGLAVLGSVSVYSTYGRMEAGARDQDQIPMS